MDRCIYQSVAAKPPSGVGANADGVLSRVMRGEGEPTLGRVVTRQHHLAKWVLYLSKYIEHQYNIITEGRYQFNHYSNTYQTPFTNQPYMTPLHFTIYTHVGIQSTLCIYVPITRSHTYNLLWHTVSTHPKGEAGETVDQSHKLQKASQEVPKRHITSKTGCREQDDLWSYSCHVQQSNDTQFG